jgi:hypothetical protein
MVVEILCEQAGPVVREGISWRMMGRAVAPAIA